MRSLLITLSSLLAAACGPPESPFPEDFPEAWEEARVPCVLSHDHDLLYVRVWADALAYEPYTTFESPYPEGAQLLKVLYADEECADMVGYVTMEKLAPGTDPDSFDWAWRQFEADGRERVDPRRIPETCIVCHEWHCGELPYGWDLTCSPDGLEPSTPFPGGG